MRSFSAYCSSWALSWGRRHIRRTRLKLALVLLRGSRESSPAHEYQVIVAKPLRDLDERELVPARGQKYGGEVVYPPGSRAMW
jgi:hypothetical protein